MDGAAHLENDLPRSQFAAVMHPELQLDLGIDDLEDLPDKPFAAEDPPGLGDDAGIPLGMSRDEQLGGDVPFADIFLESFPEEIQRAAGYRQGMTLQSLFVAKS